MRKVASDITQHHYFVINEEERLALVGLMYLLDKYGAIYDLDAESQLLVRNFLKGFGNV